MPQPIEDPNLKRLIENPEPSEWEFVRPEDPKQMHFIYRRYFEGTTVSVGRQGSGIDTEPNYTMHLVFGMDDVREIPYLIAKEIFRKIEDARGEVKSILEDSIKLPLIKTDANENLPLLSNKDVVAELRSISDEIAPRVIDILALAASPKWQAETPVWNEHNTFAYKLRSGSYSAIVRYSGDLTDHVKGSYELNIFQDNEPFFSSSYAIAEHLFETIEAHRGELAVWREENL